MTATPTRSRRDPATAKLILDCRKLLKKVGAPIPPELMRRPGRRVTQLTRETIRDLSADARKALEDRFWAKTERDPATGCLNWTPGTTERKCQERDGRRLWGDGGSDFPDQTDR